VCRPACMRPLAVKCKTLCRRPLKKEVAREAEVAGRIESSLLGFSSTNTVRSSNATEAALPKPHGSGGLETILDSLHTAA